MGESGFGRVGVFGMGLVGGSIARGLRDRGLVSELHAYDPDPGALEAATALGAADVAHATIGPWVAELDWGVLAAPVRVLEGLAAAIAPFARPGSRWLDVGSVKGPVVRALGPLLPNFVGTHPMAGRETPGVQHADPALLQSAVWCVTPTASTDVRGQPAFGVRGEPTPGLREEVDTVNIVSSFIEALGAHPFLIDPDVHDRLVARISHVPYFLAVALNLWLARDPERDRLLFLAAGGFRDLTRVASGAPEMSRDMVLANAPAVREALADLSGVLASLADTLDDPTAFLAQATEAKRTRDLLPIVRRSMLPRVYDVILTIPDRPLALARLTTVLGEANINIRDIEILKVRDTGGEAIRVGVGSADDQTRAREVLAASGYRVR